MNAQAQQFTEPRHEPGTILLLCSGCDLERDAPVAFCPACEERTVSYEWVVGFDYASAFWADKMAEAACELGIPRNLVVPLSGADWHGGRFGG